MRIHFQNIDGHNVASAKVEIPDQILNHFLVSEGAEGSYVDIPHVRNGSFTRLMGDAPLQFTELEDKLPMPDSEHKEIHVDFPPIVVIDKSDFDAAIKIMQKKGIHVDLPVVDILKKLGFKKKGPAIYSHPRLDNDSINFDPQTDDIAFIIKKVFDAGFDAGYNFLNYHKKK